MRKMKFTHKRDTYLGYLDVRMRNMMIAFLLLVGMIMIMTVVSAINVFATSGGASVVTENFRMFYDIVAALAGAIGSILLLWNVVEWGITMNSQEGMMQAKAFKGIGGALVMILAPQIITGFVFQ